MNLQDYPTPETDAAINLATDPNGAIELCNVSESLERRLSACREFIQETIDMGHLEQSHIEAAKEILEQTKP